jgi:hypothetical protein
MRTKEMAMADQASDDTATSAEARMAEKLNMTDDDLSQMSPEELQEASAKLKEVQGALDDVE